MNAHAICLGLSQRQQHEWGSTLDIPVGLTRIDGMERAVASPNMCVCAIIGEADSSPLDTARAVHHHWPMASILIATTSDKLVDIRGQLSTAVGVPSDIQIIADEDLRQLRFATSELIQQGGKRFEYRPVLKDANTKLDSAPKYVPILPMATEELLERLPVGVMLLGADGKAEYVNKVGQSMAGASILEETSVSWGEWLPKAQSSQLQKLIQGLGLGGRASHGVIEVSPILGPPLCLEVEASACSDENSSSKTLLVMQDVTARNAAEEAKTRFLANVSHEFRTPLNAIIGYGEILESECGLSQDQRGKIATLNGAAQHLLLLINNVLEFASIEAGAVQLKSEPFDL
ncbi:MAG: histidine kinase dimerization/phospho-acceptor domain-containing protein, partial [Oceanococcus sp.]